MSIKCPNKNTPEWRALEASQPDLAYYYWDKYDGEIPASLLGKSDEVIYYSKVEAFSQSEQKFKNDISVKMRKDLVKNRSKVSGKRFNGERTIMHTIDGKNASAKIRKQTVESNHRYLVNLNEAQSNGTTPFEIITKPDTVTNEKNELGEKITIPNYDIKVNEDYLDIEWTKFKEANEEASDNIENGPIGPKQLSFFSKKNRLADAEGSDEVSVFEDKLNLMR